MTKYRLLSLIISITMCAQLIPHISFAQSAKEFEPIQAASSMTDEEFFGIWSGSDWILEPKLDYSAEGMEKTAEAAKVNDMELAKEELLAYYQSKDTKPAFSGGTSASMNYLTLNDSYTFTESYITSHNISGSGYKTYDINLSKTTANGAIMLCTLEKMQDVIEIKSRESDASPELLFLTGDGIVKVQPERDTYIRGGAYADTNYGTSDRLYVKDSYTQKADGSYLPYGDNSRYTYIYFNPADFPSSYNSIKLRFTARVIAEEGSEFADEEIKLAVFQAYNKTWSEYTGDEENQKGNPPITWNNYKIGHYSWKGLPGGYDWKKPANTASEWFNYNTRFYDQTSLMRTAENNGYTGTDANGYGYGDDYVYKAMCIMQDFIADGGAGIPVNRDIESTNRCLEFPALYYRYIHTDYITPEQNAAMLKWLWQEAEYLYNGAGVLYRGATAIPANEEIAHNNRGAWHVYGFLNTVGNFPEFAKCGEWTELIEARLIDNIDVLLQPDGSYDEPTFSYPISVMNFFIQIGNLYKTLDIEAPDNYYEKLRKFGRYLMDCMYPTGYTPWWGDGRGNPKGIVSSLLNYVEDDELSYMVGKGGSYPAQHHSLYKDAKVATDRTSWDAPSSVIFMNAMNGGSHSHRDSLAFTWYHQDRELLTDTGVSSYDSKHPHFYWQRNRSISHNTVEVDEKGQAASGDSDIDITANDGTSVITSWTDANADVRHYRNVSYIKPFGLILVNDRLTPEDDKTHTYTQNWHTPPLPSPDTTLEDSGSKQGETHYATGSNLIVAPAEPQKMTATLENGYNADGAVSTKFISYKQQTAGIATFDTALYAAEEGTAAAVNTSAIALDTDNDTDSAMNIDITKNGKAYRMAYYNSFEHDGGIYSFGNYTSNGSQAGVCVDEQGNIVYASVTGGDKIYAGSNAIIQTNTDYSDITLYADENTLSIYSSADIANSEITVTGFSDDISEAYVNGKQVNIEKKDGKIYANSQFNYISDSAGSFTGKNGENLFWNYYADSKILQFHGEGEMGDYSGTVTPWSQFAADATALWISPGITGVTQATLEGIDSIKEVYMDESCFDTSWTTTSPDRYNTDGMAIITDETYTADNLPPDYDGKTHKIDTAAYSYGPDTWAERVHTVKPEYKFSDTAKYIATSGTDSIAYQPQEIQINSVPLYYFCHITGTYNWEVNPVTGRLTLDTPMGDMDADLVRSGKFYPWYGMVDKITSIYFNDNVKKLSKHHFDGLVNVKSIRFSPNMYQFGAYAFTNCIGLETITIPGNISSISSKSFMGCINLKEVIILTGSNQAGISGDAFSGCTNLKTLVLPSNVVNIAGSKSNWENAKKLTSTIENCSIYAAPGSAGQLYAEAMGSNYIELNQLADGNGTVADTGVHWSYDAETNTIVFDGEGTIPALYNCPGSFEQNMWKAYCGANSTIRLGIGVDMEKNAFQGVSQAKAIYCGLDNCNFTYKKNANLTFPASFTLDDGTEICSANGLIDTSRFDKGYFDCETTATAYPYYGYYDSYDSSNSWDDINNSRNTTYMGTVYYEYNFDTRQLTITPTSSPNINGQICIGNMSILNRLAYPWGFAGISSMAEELIFETADGLTLTMIGKSSFTEFSKLTDLVVPDGVKSIGMRAFKNCTSLKRIVIPGTAGTVDGYCFANCSSAEEVVVEFGASVGSTAFAAEISSDKTLATDTIICYAGTNLTDARLLKRKNGTDTYQMDVQPYVNNTGSIVKYALPYDADALIIVAGYDQNGKMTAIETKQDGVTANGYYEYISDINPDDCHSYKIMIWDKNNLQPLAIKAN